MFERISIEEIENILNSIEDGMIAVDKHGIIFIFNAAAENLLGIKASKALGKPADKALGHSQLLGVLKSGEKEIGQQREIGNKTIFVNRVPLYSHGELTGAVSIFRDFTEYKKLLTEINSIQEMKVLLEAIINTTTDAISVVDEKGICIMYNPAYAKLAGVSSEEYLNKPADIYLVPGKVESLHLKVIRTSQPVTGIKMQVGKANKYVLVNAAPIIVNGTLKGSVAVTHDLSEIRRLTAELENAMKKIKDLEGKYTFENIIGVSNILTTAKDQAQLAAQTPATILLRGESGTGKELFAHAIHNESSRRSKPFIRVNCAAINDTLLESELFGYIGGSFTGAKQSGHRGLFEEADGGTIFLDEIGEMGTHLQAKLLRVLQEKEITRVGDTKTISVNVRVIAATNANLEEMIKKGQFREDLYYRLNLFPVRIPPLRERKEDIPFLVNAIVAKHNKEFGRNVTEIAPEAIDLFNNYDWPGNIRELENIIGHSMITMKYNALRIELPHVALPRQVDHNAIDSITLPNSGKEDLSEATYDILFDEWEKALLIRIMKKTNNNKTAAAKILDISTRNLYNKLVKYGIK